MMYEIVFSKQARKDAARLGESNLKRQAQALHLAIPHHKSTTTAFCAFLRLDSIFLQTQYFHPPHPPDFPSRQNKDAS